MPGILYHLSFAEQVYRKLETVMPLDKISFMSGNLIPDLAVDKKKSHYRMDASVKGFFVPQMDLVKRDLLFPEDSTKFGMFCHLYLDYYFIEEFLIPEFIWDVTNGKVINPRNNKEWDKDTFFSNAGMYGAYTEINQLLLSDGRVSSSTLEQIPELLPCTGMVVFDTRRAKTWKTELEGYLAEKKDYTGEIFDYDRLWSFIERISDKLAREVFAHIQIKDEKMNIIFLDVDGVLNSVNKLLQVYNETGKPHSGYNYPFDEECLANLVVLVHFTNAKLVITSSWRKDEQGRNTLLNALKEFGLDTEVIGYTPVLNTTRGAEIKEYLSGLNYIPNFVILDDRADMDEFAPKLVRTDAIVGLSTQDVHKAMNILMH